MENNQLYRMLRGENKVKREQLLDYEMQLEKKKYLMLELQSRL